MAIPDLITSDYALTYLSLSAADQTRLPGIITAASRLARRHCGRFFSRRPNIDLALNAIDEVHTAPLRGDILLSEYPINNVFRVSTCKTAVFSVINNNALANQRAVARLVTTGDPISGFVTTGLYLEWWASGVMNNTTINFSGLGGQTLAALATAVNAVGSGWQGWPADGGSSGSDDYSLWPVVELRPGQGAQGALQSPAEFFAWVDDVEIERNDEAGTIAIVETQNNPFTSLRFGPMGGMEWGDQQLRGSYQGVRVVYDAGYDEIPDDLMQAVVEITKAMLDRKATSTTIQRERTGVWDIWLREVIDSIPESARQVLAYYRSNAS